MLVESITAANQTDVKSLVTQEGKRGASQGHGTDMPSRGTEDVQFLKDILDVTQQHFHISDVGLNFSVHGETGRIKVSVTNKRTGDLIREIPPEQVLNLMAKLDEMMGIIFDAQA